MWNDVFLGRDTESQTNYQQTGFVDRKGVEWKVAWRALPERRGRIALDFASVTGKRRTAEIQPAQLEALLSLSDQAWQALLANAAVIELE